MPAAESGVPRGVPSLLGELVGERRFRLGAPWLLAALHLGRRASIGASGSSTTDDGRGGRRLVLGIEVAGGPAPGPTSLSAGISLRQRSKAYGQRGLKAQPGGRFSSAAAGRGCPPACPCAVSLGRLSMSSRV